ncbi:nucleotidyltransferase family protein [Arenimonas sp.]|uniref:nucleotidyltransferase domain-containing protein n=1 Tax=Arenimonas sp. TaxID=1872635 RepID=UPI0039E631F1
MPAAPNGNSAKPFAPDDGGPEASLLRLIACVDLDEARRLRIRELFEAGLDASRLIELAKAHGLRPLLFRHIERSLGPALPRDLFSTLWVHQEQLTAKNRRMRDELLTIVDLFEREGIPVLPLKGPVLALQAYGDLSLREFGDLDLLVPPSRRTQARRLLAERGYVSFFPISAAAERALLDSPAHYHIALKRDLMVELHWKTDAEFAVEPAGDAAWWESLERTRIGDTEVRCLAPHEQLLALCLHGSKHHWSSLHWLVDINELLKTHPDLDWDWILGRARGLGATKRLALGIRLLRDQLHWVPPPRVGSWLDGQTSIARLADEIASDWFELPARQLGTWPRLRRNLSLYETLPRRLRHIVNVILRPSLVEWSRWPLPPPLFFLYLPLRAGRLLAKQLRA